MNKSRTFPKRFLIISGLICGLAALLALGFALLMAIIQPHPTLKELKAIPGTTLTYPKSTPYIETLTNSKWGVDGGTPASIAVEACASGTTERELIAWFNDQLTKSGWHRDLATRDFDPGLYTNGYSWVNNSRRFDVLIETRTNADRTAEATGHILGCITQYRTLAQ